MSSILAFSFPIEDAARAIKSLPQQLPTSVKITGTVTSLHQMVTLQKPLINQLGPSFFHLDLSDLQGLPFIGFWTAEDIQNTEVYVLSGFCGTICTSISLPKDIQFIGNESFENCKNLTELTIPEGVQVIGNYTFLNCSSLEKIQLPSTLRSIGGVTFANCSSFKELEIPEGGGNYWNV